MPYNFSHVEAGKGFEIDSSPIQPLLIHKLVLILIKVRYTVKKANRGKKKPK